MSRRRRTIVVLGFELCLAAGFCASFIYFVLESRDFVAGTGATRAVQSETAR